MRKNSTYPFSSTLFHNKINITTIKSMNLKYDNMPIINLNIIALL